MKVSSLSRFRLIKLFLKNGILKAIICIRKKVQRLFFGKSELVFKEKLKTDRKQYWYILRSIVFAKASRSFMPIVDIVVLLRVGFDLKWFLFLECSLHRILSLCLNQRNGKKKNILAFRYRIASKQFIYLN